MKNCKPEGTYRVIHGILFHRHFLQSRNQHGFIPILKRGLSLRPVESGEVNFHIGGGLHQMFAAGCRKGGR